MHTILETYNTFASTCTCTSRPQVVQLIIPTSSKTALSSPHGGCSAGELSLVTQFDAHSHQRGGARNSFSCMSVCVCFSQVHTIVSIYSILIFCDYQFSLVSFVDTTPSFSMLHVCTENIRESGTKPDLVVGEPNGRAK